MMKFTKKMILLSEDKYERLQKSGALMQPEKEIEEGKVDTKENISEQIGQGVVEDDIETPEPPTGEQHNKTPPPPGFPDKEPQIDVANIAADQKERGVEHNLKGQGGRVKKRALKLKAGAQSWKQLWRTLK